MIAEFIYIYLSTSNPITFSISSTNLSIYDDVGNLKLQEGESLELTVSDRLLGKTVAPIALVKLFEFSSFLSLSFLHRQLPIPSN